jgi:hypothetical protein
MDSSRDLLGVGDPAEQLLDYLSRQITEHWGPSPRSKEKELSIVRGFIGRHGEEVARKIVRFVCEGNGCAWRGSPMSVSRLTRSNDPWFADLILKDMPDGSG